MQESQHLLAARNHLATAERLFESADSLLHLEEGLALLDEISASGEEEHAVAETIAATYATKIFARVQNAIATQRAISQPRLEHFFKLMLAFDTGDFELPTQAAEAKIDVVRRLIDLLYEGYPAAAKQAALERLGEIAGRKA